MRYAHDRGLIAEPVEHLAPGLSRLPGVVVGAHAELGVFPWIGEWIMSPVIRASWPGGPTSTEQWSIV